MKLLINVNMTYLKQIHTTTTLCPEFSEKTCTYPIKIVYLINGKSSTSKSSK